MMRANAFRLFLITAALTGLLALSGGIASPAGAARSCAMSRTALSAGRGFLAAARSGSPAAFSRALGRHVNMRSVALFALGRYRRKLPRGQYGRFVRLSRNYVARKLAGFSRGFRAGPVRVVRCGRNYVETRFGPRNQRVLWRFSGRGIVDVNFQNVWLAQILRDHYARLIRQSGGDMTRFMAALR